jgi:hypothetical protein
MPNVENINKVIEMISACQPDEINPEPGIPIFDMGTFLDESHTCGTRACIGGYAYVAAGGTVDDEDCDSEKKAADFLGIDMNAANHLFYPDEVDGSFEATPQEAVKVLEHLRDMGKVDWTVFNK